MIIDTDLIVTNSYSINDKAGKEIELCNSQLLMFEGNFHGSVQEVYISFFGKVEIFNSSLSY